jgi:hypothetical protein
MHRKKLENDKTKCAGVANNQTGWKAKLGLLLFGTPYI